MKFATVLPVFMACSHAMHLPNTGNKYYLQKRAEKDHAFSGSGDAGDKVSFEVDYGELAVPIARRDIDPPRYIVVFKKGEAESAYKTHEAWISKQFSELHKRGDLPADVADKVESFNVLLKFMGYAVYLPPTLLDDVKKDPIVDFVEKDQIYEANKFAKQKDAPWGVARISQRANAVSADYDYDNQAGKGVTAYVIDSGIKVDHPDFEGRAKWGTVIPPQAKQEDEDGHGTHIAGTIGGKTYGIAKKVNLVAVKIYNEAGKGKVSDMIKGVEYAVNDYEAQVKVKPKGYRGAVINLSGGGPASDALDRAVNAAMDAGVHVVVSAGNKNLDACGFSPGRATGPITVGATSVIDLRGDYSNWGACVDVQAPGTDILSAGTTLTSATKTGTSFAVPHVAGILATFMSLQPNVGSEFGKDPPVKPVDLKRMFLRFSTRGVVKKLDKASPNKLAYNGAGLDLKDLWIL